LYEAELLKTETFEYEILSDCFQEIESLERAFETLGATKLNREGWPTSYGDTGIKLWVEIYCPKKNIKEILKVTEAKLLKCSPVEAE
jgi:hypothetical protein